MRTLGLVLTVLVSLFACQRELRWETLPPSPIARCESAAVRIGDELYVFGGFDGAGEKEGTDVLFASTRIDALALESGNWRNVGEMPVATTHRNAVYDGRYVWLAGGFEGDHPGRATSAVWRFEAATGDWERGPDLPAPRAAGALTVVEGALHFFGGFGSDRDATHGEHWRLELARASAWIAGERSGEGWQSRAPLGVRRGHLAAVTVDGLVYALGGQRRHDTEPQDLAAVEVYEPARDTWRNAAPIPEPLSHFEAAAFSHSGSILIAGGRNNAAALVPWDGLSDRIHRVDLRSGQWSIEGHLPVRLLGAVAEVYDGRLLVATGARDAWNRPVRQSYRAELNIKPRLSEHTE